MKYEILKLIQSRFSVRSYEQKAVEIEKLNYILECARLAPSACNNQPWQLIVAKSEEAKANVQAVYKRDWFAAASVYIIVCANHFEAWKRADGKSSGDIDTAIIAEHICLAVAEMDLGTCWVCNFDLQKLKENFQLPEEIEPIAIFPIGYPKNDIQVPEKKRKILKEIVKYY